MVLPACAGHSLGSSTTNVPDLSWPKDSVGIREEGKEVDRIIMIII